MMRVTIVVAGWEFAIEVSSQEKVIEIKRKIEQLLNVPVESQTLTIWGWEMMDGFDMEDYHPIITDGTKIHLTIISNDNIIYDHHQEIHSKIHVTVKFPARKIDMEVEKFTETVRSLKEKIHIVDGTPIKRMSLYFSGNEMDDDFRYLRDYGILNNSATPEILVFLKNAGGGGGGGGMRNNSNNNEMVSDRPSRKVSLVIQTSSSLMNSACIPVEISDLCTTADLNELLLSRKILPRDDYIYIHKQRIMRDSCSLRWHGVENRDFLYVFKGTVSPGR